MPQSGHGEGFPPTVLEFPLDLRPDVLHPAAIHAEIPVADARGGAKVDRLGCFIEEKFHVVDEPQEKARKFVMKIAIFFLDQVGAREATDNGLQDGFRV